ncbi:MAG: hypothetical protein RBU37_28430 [Myxococcota bacterium]|nr:hypothetical protein [Myxococcota bacterium]
MPFLDDKGLVTASKGLTVHLGANQCDIDVNQGALTTQGQVPRVGLLWATDLTNLVDLDCSLYTDQLVELGTFDFGEEPRVRLRRLAGSDFAIFTDPIAADEHCMFRRHRFTEMGWWNNVITNARLPRDALEGLTLIRRFDARNQAQEREQPAQPLQHPECMISPFL